MRVAMIAPPWLPVPPTGYGGTELVLDGLCRGLLAAGHDVLLCTTGDSTCPVERFSAIDEALGTAMMPSASELRHVIAAYAAVADWGADVVHDHTLVGPVYATRTAQVPIVTTNHGPFDADLFPLYESLSGRVPIVAISEHQASTSMGIPIAKVIHHGIDVSRFPVGRGQGGYAAFLGRMTPTKGVEAAVHIARAAGVPLRIAAKMRERAEHEYFASCIRPLLGPDVEYIGEVDLDDKLQLLAEATCLLNPIDWPEPFGMVMVEALACGTPVVATPSGAAPEIVDDGVTGFLRRGRASLAAALTSVSSLDRSACRAAVEARFSIARMAADHEALYTELSATPAETRLTVVR